MSELDSKKLGKRKFDRIKSDGNEIINYSKDSQESELQKNSTNINKFEVRKRMLKSRSDDADILIKQNRRSTLKNHQLE